MSVRRRGGRVGTHLNANLHVRSPDKEDEPQTKIPRIEAANEKLPDLLKLPKDILIKTFNKLDPDSFRELAYSCKALYHFCFNTENLAVVFPVREVHVKRGLKGVIEYYHTCHCGKDWFGTFEEYLKRLRKWPFVIHIDVLEIHKGWSRNHWNQKHLEVKKLFVEVRVEKIRFFSQRCPITLGEVQQFDKEFIKEFKIKEIEFRRGFGEEPKKEAIGACLKLLLIFLQMPCLSGDLHVDHLIDCSIPVLETELCMPLTAMDTIIEIWQTRNLESWKFNYSLSSAEFANYFDRYEIRLFTNEGFIDRKNPPVFMRIKHGGSNMNGFSFYFLRQDGKVFRVSVDPLRYFYDSSSKCILFQMCPSDEAPLALRDL